MKCKLLLPILCLLLCSCVNNQNMGVKGSNGKLEHWVTFKDNVESQSKLGDKQSRVFFYREYGDIVGPAINIYVNDDYLTSLLAGGYKDVVICSYGSKLLPAFSRNYQFANRKNGIDYNFLTGKDSYLKLIFITNNKLAFQEVTYQEWKDAVKHLKYQTQTLSRVQSNKTCKKAVVDKKTLSINSLFKFDKYHYQDLLPAGKLKIKELGKEYKNKSLGIISMKLIGYTDPQGSEQYNIKLSQRRVETIRLALQKEGINVPITTESLGKNNLIVPDCEYKYPYNRSKRIQCDQPNRRVDIIFYAEKYMK